MSDPKTVSKTPSEQLAEKILGALEAANLVLPADKIQIADSLANGKLRSEDWRVAIEKSIDKEGAT